MARTRKALVALVWHSWCYNLLIVMIRFLKSTLQVHHVLLRAVSRRIGSTKLLFLALLSIILPARATVYYVDSGSGSDSNAGTSTSAAWAHVPGAAGFSGGGWQTIVNGDTIVVKGGSMNLYQITFNTSSYNGSAENNTIIIISRYCSFNPWGS